AASRFAVVDPNADKVFYPFVVQGNKVFIDSAFISNGSITSAQIGDYIQSTDYVPGEVGWRLNKSGSIEFNGPVAGGGRLSINNQLMQIFYGDGSLCLRAGIWS
ncbi:phage tail tip fiber protein, partial [Mesorhizobium japonicum]